MLLRVIPSAVFATNCYVLSPGVGEECLVVDPGIDVVDRLGEILTELRLRPAAVLLTHGHVDHTYSVTPVCGAHGVSAYVHGDDRYRLVDPLDHLDPGLIAALEQQFGRQAQWQEPSDVIEIDGSVRLEIAGLDIGITHAPGHTEGSVLFDLPGLPDAPARDPGGDSAGDPGDEGAGDSGDEGGGASSGGLTATMLSGDVLFAGSIGRYDAAGGDATAMRTTLRDVVLNLPDDLLVLPGHGPSTTMARERATNPYLLDLGLVR